MPSTAERPILPHNERLVDKPMGLVGALAMHAVLIFGLVTVFQWRTDSEEFYAELWAPEDASGLSAHGKVAEQLPVEETVPPPPEPTPQEKAPEEQSAGPAESAKADIQLEEEKKAEELKKEAERQETLRKAEEQKKLEEQQKRLQAQQRALERKKLAEQKRLADQMRREELARIAGAPQTDAGRVGSTKGNPNVLHQNLKGSLDAGYAARVIGCIRPRISFNVPAGMKRDQYVAEYVINLLPDGSHANNGVSKVKSSGLSAFDMAVERAIHSCNPMPRPASGNIPRQMRIRFDPVDVK